MINTAIIAAMWACASSPKPHTPPPSDYSKRVSELPIEQKLKMQKSIEDFYNIIRVSLVAPRSQTLENEHAILRSLKTGEPSIWFLNFFETLVGAQLMAQSNSFRSYQNANCYDAYIRPLASYPLPPASMLISLDEFMRAGPRMPDVNTYTGQVRLFCGRRAINALQGAEAQPVNKIYLALRHNPILQKWILIQAEREAEQLLRAYREML